MASTAHKTPAEYVEHYDDEETLQRKVSLLAEWVTQSRHFIAFTGAGISTSSGVPDFRSGLNTTLSTGPGAWTIRAEEEKRGQRVVSNPGVRRVATLQAIPSHAHMALVALQQAGLLQFLVSQNTDGLHRRSGFPTQALAELHGNTNLERCAQCSKEYLRDFSTRTARGVLEHETGRHCTRCGGALRDTIINFSESLPEKDLRAAFSAADRADLCLALGSSLRVTPAATIPEMVAGKPRGRLVIVNLQATPLDDVAALRIGAQIDTVMRMLMTKLELQIPPFVLKRQVQITQWIEMPSEPKPNVAVGAPHESAAAAGAAAVASTARLIVRIEGVDADGTPVSLWRNVRVDDGRVGGGHSSTEPHQFSLRVPPPSGPGEEARVLPLRLEPFGHYREPDVLLRVPLLANSVQRAVLEYDPVTSGLWRRVELLPAHTAPDEQAVRAIQASSGHAPIDPPGTSRSDRDAAHDDRQATRSKDERKEHASSSEHKSSTGREQLESLKM